MIDTLMKLEKVIQQKDIDNLRDIIIFKDEDGTINLYGKYTIVKQAEGVYNVNVLGTYTERAFYKLTNAIAWCSFDKRKKYKEADRLHELDSMVYSMDTEIQIQAKLLKKTKNQDNAIIYLAKLSNNKAKKRLFNTEISEFVYEHMRWQTSLFDKSKLLSH